MYLQRAGLASAQILAMLTTVPAASSGAGARGGLRPAWRPTSSYSTATPQDVRVFAKVRTTIRNGRIIHGRPS